MSPKAPFIFNTLQWKIGSFKSWREMAVNYIQPSDSEAKTEGELLHHIGADGMSIDESSSQDRIITNLK